MKKILVLLMLILFLVSAFLSGEEVGKCTNLLAGIGSAVSDLEGLYMEVGVEKQFSGNVYGQFMVDYYFNPFELPDNSNSYAFGLNLYGVYKIPASDSINVFLKAGLHITMMKEDWEFIGFINTSADFGIAGGGGIEFHLSDRAFIYGGATVRTALEEKRTWIKIGGGVGFRVK
jgi:hypothetical protein